MLTKEQMGDLPEPCVVRHSYDGYGWLYSDNGNGSFWIERAMEMPDAEPAYSAATVIEQQAEIERLREQNKRLHEAAKQVETWWLEDGMQGSRGAPFCIFPIRSALGATQ